MADQVKINENELEGVSGGNGDYKEYSKGTYVVSGDHVIYTIASGDVLSGIAIKFGVTVEQIAKWNQIKDVNMIYAGQKLTIYYTHIW